MEFNTIKGFTYCVTAQTDTTVTDSDGLSHTVKAGDQWPFVANSDHVTYTGDCQITQIRGNFNIASTEGGGGGGGFDGHLDANLVIGNTNYGEYAEWLLYLGDPRHQGELHEETTGIVCSKGPDVHHTVDDILEALNVQSQFKDIIVATRVSDYVIKLTAKEAGDGPNTYRFSGDDGSDPEHPVDDPCFGLGSVGIIQTVIGSSTTVSATTYTAERNGDAILALTDVDQEVRMYSPWPVSSRAVARSLETKQDKLVFDASPVLGSVNPVTSGGVYTALRELPAPLPTALMPTTAMKNCGVYTVAAEGAALDFSAVTLGDNATAEIWIECSAETNITFPPAWLWLDGSAPQVTCDATTETSHRYRIVVLNEGPALKTVARVAYDYSNLLPTA